MCARHFTARGDGESIAGDKLGESAPYDDPSLSDGIRPDRQSRPLHVIIFQTPRNSHTLGLRFAAKVLAARRLSVEAFVAALLPEDVVALLSDGKPKVVGFSCLLPEPVPIACDFIAKLQARPEPVFRCRFIVSGHAFRFGGGRAVPTLGPGIDVVVDVVKLGDELLAAGRGA